MEQVTWVGALGTVFIFIYRSGLVEYLLKKIPRKESVPVPILSPVKKEELDLSPLLETEPSLVERIRKWSENHRKWVEEREAIMSLLVESNKGEVKHEPAQTA